VRDLHRELNAWGKVHRREFPWRQTHNAFHILLAELMLRRTRASQVQPVYRRFIADYPNPTALVQGNPSDIGDHLFPLGLAWRMPAFQAIAEVLVTQYEGQVPQDYESLTQLPGVGDYVASAVICFAFGIPQALIDTNTVRVVGRIFGEKTHAESRRNKLIRTAIQGLMDPVSPREHNYNLLDLAALVCLPNNPLCSQCPILSLCTTGQARTAENR